ncbi:MAG: hypothetical protein KF889_11435 [Alphaproteobacteria bacterium]|nr:hypothetical protein [Alphaproteobacteria bacterium]
MIVLSVVTSAGAQALDCRRPASEIDRATCRGADLMTARAAVGVAY